MKRFGIFFLALSSLLLSAQLPAADEIKLNTGVLNIQPVFHSALVITYNQLTIYIDPYGGAKAFEGLPKPNLILITDIHQDHCDLTTLHHINYPKAELVVPMAVAKKLEEPDSLSHRINQVRHILSNGDETKLFGVTITAVPMYNLPEEPNSKHVKGRGNGYILEIAGKRIYISGDTEDIPEMRNLKNIDIAFVCMNLPYTMDIHQAADAVLAFKPKVVYPFHYRGKDGFSDIEVFKKIVNDNNPEIEVRTRNWYPEYN